MAKVIGDQVDISQLIRAQALFAAALKEAKSTLEKDGAVQRFEFSYELFWKTLKKVLEFQGKICNSPRETFREAAVLQLVDDPDFWFEVIRYRNLTVHLYDEEIAEQIYKALPAICSAMKKTLDKIQTL